MPRTCNCAGPCGPENNDDASGVSRRGFLTLLSTGVIAASATEEADAAPAEPNKPRTYRSGRHTDARFPLGGIGTGGFEVGADGRFTTWQLWSTLRDGFVPFFLGVRAGKTARALQTAGTPPGIPTVRATEMTGEYPVADLAIRDPDLPVAVTVTAFTPLAPLDIQVSSIPCACFVVKLKNTGKTAQEVSVGAFLQNPVGYDALGAPRSNNRIGFNVVPALWSNTHPNLGGNRNEPFREGGVTGVTLRANAAPPVAPLSAPLTVFTNVDRGALDTHAVERPANLTLRGLDDVPAQIDSATAKRAVFWLEATPLDLAEATLRAVRNAVAQGASLLWAGPPPPDAKEKAAPDVLFEDFENGYGKWEITGTAFGTSPPTGTLPNQQAVSGFAGKGMVNSFRDGDDTTGKLTSQPFTIERRYIRLLVGGGNHPTTQVRLIVDGKTVRAQSGRNEEWLARVLWDVAEWKGKTAHIEIVDEQTGPWGHINADHIEFSDLPVSAPVLALLGELSHSGALGTGRVTVQATPLLRQGQAELIGIRQKVWATLAELTGTPLPTANGVLSNAPGWGSIAIGMAPVKGGQPSILPAFTDWGVAWSAFADQGAFPVSAKPSAPTLPGTTTNAAVATSVNVAPGATVEVPVFLTWHFPNRVGVDGKTAVGNHYATRWPDAHAVLRDLTQNFSSLRSRTEKFRAALFDSSLPPAVCEAVSSQISTIRHPGILMRTGDGTFYGWEGSNGCCPPTCTHVWGYAQTPAYLFPGIERDMRRIDYKHQQNANGGINNRVVVPSPPRPTGEHPFADGHASCVLKAYRELRAHSDPRAFLKDYGPRVLAAVDYLIARDAASSPDNKPDGTISDDQWNTYDNAIHGVNSFIGTYYLAALRAGEEVARLLKNNAAADRYHAVFEAGQKNLIDRCWNGDYFEQHLPGYEKRTGEYGPGCLSDQVIGQWWAHQLDLGYLLPPDKIKAALQAVYKHNRLTDFTDFRHNWRKFAGGKDKGLLICTWPRGGRPARTIPYVDEVWTGIEYQVAAHMVYEGMIDEALTLVADLRDRYDGLPRAPIPRNPWNEIECGGHYARALASWSLLLALSGYSYDGLKGSLHFAPRHRPEDFKSLFTAAEGWGTLRQTRQGQEQISEISVIEGQVRLRQLQLGIDGDRLSRKVQVQVQGKPVRAAVAPLPASAAAQTLSIAFDAPLTLMPGGMMRVTLG